MKSHIIINHDKAPSSCKFCNEVFVGKKKLHNHMRVHQEESCKFCSKKIPKNAIRAHLAVCERNQEKESFKCEQCPFISNRKDKLKNHTESVHKEKDLPQKESTKETKRKPTKPTCEKHECAICGKTFARQFHLTRHLNTIHLKKKIESSTMFGFFEENEIVNQASTNQCDICGYHSTRTNNMKRHKEKHLNEDKPEKITKCDKCDYTSPYPYRLRKHIENHQNVGSRSTKYRELKKIKDELNIRLKEKKEKPSKVFGEKEVKMLLEDCEGCQRDLLRVIKWMRKCFGRKHFSPNILPKHKLIQCHQNGFNPTQKYDSQKEKNHI